MPKKKPPNKRDKTRQPKKEAFLAAYASCGVLSHAAKLAGCHRDRHYHWLEDPDYAKRFDQAHEAACDVLEKEARRRAVKGVLKPVFQGGGRVGAVRQYSDTLLIFLMKGAMPEKYRERLDFSGKVDHEAMIGVILDGNFYQTAVARCAGAPAPPTGSADAPGAKQGRRVRKALGKNGTGANGNGTGTRPQ